MDGIFCGQNKIHTFLQSIDWMLFVVKGLKLMSCFLLPPYLVNNDATIGKNALKSACLYKAHITIRKNTEIWR